MRNPEFGWLQMAFWLAVIIGAILLIRLAGNSGFFEHPCDADPTSMRCDEYQSTDNGSAHGL